MGSQLEARKSVGRDRTLKTRNDNVEFWCDNTDDRLNINNCKSSTADQ